VIYFIFVMEALSFLRGMVSFTKSIVQVSFYNIINFIMKVETGSLHFNYSDTCCARPHKRPYFVRFMRLNS